MFHKKSLVSDFFRPEFFRLSRDRRIPEFPARHVTGSRAGDNPQAFKLSRDRFQTAKRKESIWLCNCVKSSRLTKIHKMEPWQIDFLNLLGPEFRRIYPT